MKALTMTVGSAALILMLAGCSDEKPLPGKRIDVRDSVDMFSGTAELENVGASPAVSRNAPIALPGQVNHSAWTHRGGSATHRVTHPALGSNLQQIWSRDIGEGDTRKGRITADPVVASGRIFTQDSRSRVMAHSTAGAPLWSRDLVPAHENKKDASGGGLAYGAGKLFVTTGFGELHALNPKTGGTIWVQDFDAPVAGAPTVRGDLVYVTSRDNRAFAIRTSNGRLAWELPGTPTPSATVNGSGPAVTDSVAVFPFGSAELVATLRQGGLRKWDTTLSGQRLGFAYGGVSDVSSDPVVAGSTLYAGSPSGRIAAIDINSGDRRWTASEGALSPVWVTGGSVFAVTDLQQLVRLDAGSGQVIWAVDMARFKNTKKRRIRDVYAHYGPVLAGGRLIVASDDGGLRSFSPQSGKLLSGVQIPGGAASNPVVVNRTLYLVTADGKLAAFR